MHHLPLLSSAIRHDWLQILRLPDWFSLLHAYFRLTAWGRYPSHRSFSVACLHASPQRIGQVPLFLICLLRFSFPFARKSCPHTKSLSCLPRHPSHGRGCPSLVIPHSLKEFQSAWVHPLDWVSMQRHSWPPPPSWLTVAPFGILLIHDLYLIILS